MNTAKIQYRYVPSYDRYYQYMKLVHVQVLVPVLLRSLAVYADALRCILAVYYLIKFSEQLCCGALYGLYNTDRVHEKFSRNRKKVEKKWPARGCCETTVLRTTSFLCTNFFVCVPAAAKYR